tara:strand:- start:6889 stop:7914 length:1026 start_codon:yes stop_codon:yes gene_type:complete
MEFETLIIVFFSLFLYLINFFLKKKKLLIDNIKSYEEHKKLLSLNRNTPLSGGVYFGSIIIFLFYSQELFLTITCVFFILLGMFSDLKLITSPKLRLVFQLLIIFFFISLTPDITIDTRINWLNSIMQNSFLKPFMISFFFLVLINGFNFIDGVNNLSSLNFLIILIFIYLLLADNDSLLLKNEILILILCMSVFTLFNSFGKNFMGDGAIYGVSFLIGYVLVKISSFNYSISPYFIANLLWYPAFENLFTIMRRLFKKKKNYLPDNSHLHQKLFKFLNKKKVIKKKYLLSTFVGISINLFLSILYIVGYIYNEKTDVQICLIFIGILIYLSVFLRLKKLS